MNKLKLGFYFLCVLTIAACNQSEKEKDLSLVLHNPSTGGAIKQLVSVEVPANLIQDNLPLYSTQYPSEWQQNSDGSGTLTLLAKLNPGKQAQIPLSTSRIEFNDMAYAELSVRTGGEWRGKEYVADGFEFKNVKQFTAPEQLTDHSYYLRYEGPGWENNLVGYRLYLDWRNGIDVFAKKTTDMVLSEVGQDGYDSYHEQADWGADVLKVGKSLGLGSLGRLSQGNVMHFQQVSQTSWNLLSDTKLISEFNVTYKGWDVNSTKVDVSTTYRIHGDDPTTMVNVQLSDKVNDLVTGIVKHPNTEFITLKNDEWAVIATYGNQNMLGDSYHLGMALFYRIDDAAKSLESEHDYLIQFKPTNELNYGFLAAWPEHDSNPQNQQQFEMLLAEKIKALTTPIEVIIKP